MVGIAMGLKCPVCAAEDRADSLLMCLRDPTTKQAGHFRPTRRAVCFFGAAPRSTIRVRYAILTGSCEAPDGNPVVDSVSRPPFQAE